MIMIMNLKNITKYKNMKMEINMMEKYLMISEMVMEYYLRMMDL